MDNHRESPQPELQAFGAYAVIVNIQDNTHTDDVVKEIRVFTHFKDAVSSLRKQRLQIEDGFITTQDAASRDQHPFRNRIGYFRRSNGTHIGWGYSWQRNGSNYVNRAWIQKTVLWLRDDKVLDIEELSNEEIEEIRAEGNIDYDALGQRKPSNAVFDKASKDFVFEGEMKYTRDYSESSTR
jgi:hypothetical protein